MLASNIPEELRIPASLDMETVKAQLRMSYYHGSYLNSSESVLLLLSLVDAIVDLQDQNEKLEAEIADLYDTY